MHIKNDTNIFLIFLYNNYKLVHFQPTRIVVCYRAINHLLTIIEKKIEIKNFSCLYKYSKKISKDLENYIICRK